MARIKLIVTGDLERKALVDALKRCFRQINAVGEEVEWDTEPRKIDEVTTGRLPELSELVTGQFSEGKRPKYPATAMKVLASALVEEVISGKRRGEPPPELVIALCDVELGNLGREHVILSHLREALRQKLEERDEVRARDRHRGVLRNRCSFHLFRPMVEAAFFGDPSALTRAGIPGSVTPCLRSGDVEDFESDDPHWLPICAQENEAKQRESRAWWREEKHPKRYLEHLSVRSGSPEYDEVQHGVGALRGLDWALATRSQPSPFLRSLFHDLADWFGVPSPLGAERGSPLTSLTPASPPDRWLRNL